MKNLYAVVENQNIFLHRERTHHLFNYQCFIIIIAYMICALLSCILVGVYSESSWSWVSVYSESRCAGYCCHSSVVKSWN